MKKAKLLKVSEEQQVWEIAAFHAKTVKLSLLTDVDAKTQGMDVSYAELCDEYAVTEAQREERRARS